MESFFDLYRQDNNIKYVTASASLLPTDNVVFCTTAGAAITITLPEPGLAKNRHFAISLITDGGQNVTITDKGSTSYDWTDITLADANDGALLWCDGVKYWVIADNYT